MLDGKYRPGFIDESGVLWVLTHNRQSKARPHLMVNKECVRSKYFIPRKKKIAVIIARDQSAPRYNNTPGGILKLINSKKMTETKFTATQLGLTTELDDAAMEFLNAQILNSLEGDQPEEPEWAEQPRKHEILEQVVLLKITDLLATGETLFATPEEGVKITGDLSPRDMWAAVGVLELDTTDLGMSREVAAFTNLLVNEPATESIGGVVNEVLTSENEGEGSQETPTEPEKATEPALDVPEKAEEQPGEPADEPSDEDKKAAAPALINTAENVPALPKVSQVTLGAVVVKNTLQSLQNAEDQMEGALNAVKKTKEALFNNVLDALTGEQVPSIEQPNAEEAIQD